MSYQNDSQEFYRAFADKDTSYDGRVFMGVLTTGIFCRPGCPARLPNFENVRFYATANAALNDGYRACKRCQPAKLPGEGSALVKTLIALIEDAPDKKWTGEQLKAQGIDPSTARRHFLERFGMSFSQYARQRRLAEAARTGETQMDKQIIAGYESASGFRDAFGKAIGGNHSKAEPLLADWIDTPMGPMMAIADEEALYLLEFTDRVKLDIQVEKVSKRHKRAILVGKTSIHEQIENELEAYFAGQLTEFLTPFVTTGTEFQTRIWEELCRIPYGQTRSYAELAIAAENPKGVRAAASSNARNGLAIIIPCHRVIAKDGGLGGYAGGVDRKQRLLDLESRTLAT